MWRLPFRELPHPIVLPPGAEVKIGAAGTPALTACEPGHYNPLANQSEET